MAKPLVIRPDDRVPVPFLRGILTRSLEKAGLSFEAAYEVASAVRAELQGLTEVSPAEIRKRALARLEPYGEAVVARYRTRRTAPPTILVRHPDGHAVPFSRGRQRLALAPCGLLPDQAARVVDLVLERLAARGATEVAARDLGLLLHELLGQEAGPEAARRFCGWEEFQHGDRPLLVLLGGATGTGKSTIANHVSHRLDILRVQSTDMLREVMRTLVPSQLLPVLHRSSFLACESLPGAGGDAEDREARLLEGFRAQVDLLAVACEAVLQRATQERLSLILEGVHIHPVLLDRFPASSEAIVVPVVLAVLRPAELRRRIRGRGKQATSRRAKRYLDHFEEIWRIQSFLLAEADRAGVPIVANDDVESAGAEVIGIVVAALSKVFEGRPEKVLR